MTRVATGVELRQDKDMMWYVYRGGVPVKGAKFVLSSVAESWCKAALKAKTVNRIPFTHS
ncbi:hypothetical protein D3C87_952960 [compost metagenome]